jgi:hypothetical protein
MITAHGLIHIKTFPLRIVYKPPSPLDRGNSKDVLILVLSVLCVSFENSICQTLTISYITALPNQ